MDQVHANILRIHAVVLRLVKLDCGGCQSLPQPGICATYRRTPVGVQFSVARSSGMAHETNTSFRSKFYLYNHGGSPLGHPATPKQSARRTNPESKATIALRQAVLHGLRHQFLLHPVSADADRCVPAPWSKEGSTLAPGEEPGCPVRAVNP